jgi:hypothetical protein
MQLGHSGQYGVPCLIIEEAEDVIDIDTLLEYATEQGALYHDGDDYCFVVQLPGRPVELHTEEALRRSLERLRRQTCAA